MNKKQLLYHLKNEVYCRIKCSKTHGVGVFAIRDIPKNTNIFSHSVKKYIGIPVEELISEKLDPEIYEILEDFFVEEDGKIYILENGLWDLDISHYLNHSDVSNVIFDEKASSFISSKDIKKNEEIVMNYSEFDSNWKNKRIFNISDY